VASAGGDGVTLAALATEMPTAKSTTHRYVTTLLKLGVLRRDSTGRLFLGLKLVELANALLSGDDLCRAGEPIMQDLVARTGETVHLGIPESGYVVYVAKVESPQSVRLVSQVGARVPMHRTAMGKALLAGLGSEELRRALAQSRDSRSELTHPADAILLAELEQVRASGAAIDDEENEPGVRCVGAAIVGRDHRPLGAISVSAPASRVTRAWCAELIPTIRAAADRIAADLGHIPTTSNQAR
jgi:DNA-binding IclR family transcriptional regulator